MHNLQFVDLPFPVISCDQSDTRIRQSIACTEMQYRREGWQQCVSVPALHNTGLQLFDNGTLSGRFVVDTLVSMYVLSACPYHTNSTSRQDRENTHTRTCTRWLQSLAVFFNRALEVVFPIHLGSLHTHTHKCTHTSKGANKRPRVHSIMHTRILTAIDRNRQQQTATNCNRLQQTATDCNRLQQTATSATHSNTLHTNSHGRIHT